jgi:hypothetical protein
LVWTVAVVIVVLGAALLAGLLANRRVRPFAKTEVQGVKLELLISPLLTLTVLLLAFVLVQVFAGYRASKDAAALEASRVLFEYDLADYYDDEFAQPMQESLLCYARAVAYQEWSSLDDDADPNPVVTQWARGMDAPLAELRTVDNGQPYGTLLTADKERADGRRLRIVQARAALPRGGVATARHQRVGGAGDRHVHAPVRLSPNADRRAQRAGRRPRHGPVGDRRSRPEVRRTDPDRERGFPDRRRASQPSLRGTIPRPAPAVRRDWGADLIAAVFREPTST